jgi:hypothetical protein
LSNYNQACGEARMCSKERLPTAWGTQAGPQGSVVSPGGWAEGVEGPVHAGRQAGRQAGVLGGAARRKLRAPCWVLTELELGPSASPGLTSLLYLHREISSGSKDQKTLPLSPPCPRAIKPEGSRIALGHRKGTPPGVHGGCRPTQPVPCALPLPRGHWFSVTSFWCFLAMTVMPNG